MGQIAEVIIKGVIAGKEVIPLPYHMPVTQFKDELQLAYADPWTFNVVSFTYHIRGDSVIDCCPSYSMDFLEYQKKCETIRSKIARISRALKLESKSDVEIVEAIHGYIANSMVYDDTPEDCHRLTCFISGHGVCDGISKTAVALLRANGIDSWVVRGRILDSLPEEPGHAWVMVRIGGHCYHLDGKFSACDGAFTHSMCLVDDRMASRDRTWSMPEPMPCNSICHNWYYRRHQVASSRAKLEKMLYEWDSSRRLEVLLEYSFDPESVYKTVHGAERQGAHLPSGHMYIFQNVLVIEEE